MKVNKKKLAEIFECDVRTITGWQSQGLRVLSGGGKGIEAMFNTAEAIEWYAQREKDIENEKLRKELEDLHAAAESDLQPGTIDYERYRLTKAQADAQELKMPVKKGWCWKRNCLPSFCNVWHRRFRGYLYVCR